MPCSDEYWEAVEPVFDLLKQEKNMVQNGLKLQTRVRKYTFHYYKHLLMK